MWDQLIEIGGQANANDRNSDQARKNRSFQERMSSTAHQREVGDLRAAGLNPILSAMKGGGASTPGGDSATMQNITEGAAATARDRALIKLQESKQEAEIELLGAQTRKASAEARALKLDALKGDIAEGFWNKATERKMWLGNGKSFDESKQELKDKVPEFRNSNPNKPKDKPKIKRPNIPEFGGSLG